MTGKLLLNHRIESLIREDMLGNVYLATHLTSGKSVQIRILNQELTDISLESEQLQTASARLQALMHPGICAFYSYAACEGKLYLITEHIEGVPLSEYTSSREKNLSEEEIWDIFMQVVDAFGFAHDKGIMHLNIHMDNIIVTVDQQVKILDFGISNMLLDSDSKRLHKGVTFSKLQYLSPEHLSDQALTVQTDIYSLGVLLFALLTRQDPYPSVLSAADIEKKIINDSFPLTKLYTQAFTYSYTMQAIIDKATAKSPAFRFQSCDELAASLEEEKDERESFCIAQLLDNIHNPAQLNTPARNKFAIKKVKPAKQAKFAGQMLFTLALIASSVLMGMWFSKTKSTATTGVTAVNNYMTPAEEAGSGMQDVTAHESVADNDQLTEKIEALVSEQEDENNYNNTVQAGMYAGVGIQHTGFSKMQLKNRLSRFYKALQSKDMSRITSYYAPSLTRFYNEYNVTQTRLQQQLADTWQSTPEDEYDILWNTFQYYQDKDGNYVMDFFVNHHYRPANGDRFITRNLYTIIKMDSSLKISYISSK